jgi:hypothetical protein
MGCVFHGLIFKIRKLSGLICSGINHNYSIDLVNMVDVINISNKISIMYYLKSMIILKTPLIFQCRFEGFKKNYSPILQSKKWGYIFRRWMVCARSANG